MRREVREIVENRSQGICELCMSNRAAEKHHRKLRSQGGLDFPLNLIHLCKACHTKVHSKPTIKKQLREELKESLCRVFLLTKEYTFAEISEVLDLDIDVIKHDAYKGWVRYSFKNGELSVRGDDILRWLG